MARLSGCLGGCGQREDEPERRVWDSFEAHPGVEGCGGRIDGVHDHGKDGEGLAGCDDSLQGIDEQQARTLMGKLVRDHGNDTVLDAVREAVVTQPADARAWLVKACTGSGTRPAGKRAPKAENFAEKDYGNGVEAV